MWSSLIVLILCDSFVIEHNIEFDTNGLTQAEFTICIVVEIGTQKQHP